MNKYNWEGKKYPSERDVQKKNQNNNLLIAFNVLYAKKEKKNILPIFQSKSNCQKQFIVLISTSKERWHYIAVKNLSVLLRGITSKTNRDFYCLNCCYSFKTKKNVDHIEKYVKAKILAIF